MPNPLLIYDVNHLPPSFHKAAADEAAVAAPGEALCAENGGPAPGSHSLQKLHAGQVLNGLGIGFITAPSVSSQLLSQVVISKRLFSQGLHQGFFLEMGEFARGKAADIYYHLDGVSLKQGNKFLPGTVACSQGECGFWGRNGFLITFL